MHARRWRKGNELIGTLLNVAAILVGGALGCVLGGRLPDRLRQTVVAGLGLFTLAYGVQMFLQTRNALIVLGSILVGALLGEWWQIEAVLQRLGGWLERRFNHGGDQNRFVRGFLTTAVMFCVGPMAILGAVQDGLQGDYSTLAVKAVLDGFGSLAFASSLGVGVLFSGPAVLLYQGGITLLAAQVQTVVTPAMMTEMSAVGGVILMGMAIGSLLELRPIRVGNFLPALVIAPLLVALLARFGF